MSLGTDVAWARAVDIARKPRVSGNQAWAVAIAGALTFAAAATYAARATPAAAPAIEKSGVWTERVKRGDLVRQVAVQGTLVPERVQWLSAVSAARVARILVRPGAHVEADTVVLALENADLELAALEAERAAASAESALIALDVRTDADAKLQESSLATVRADLSSATKLAEAADWLGPQGLMSDLDRQAAQARARGLLDRKDAEEARRTVLVGGRDRQLGAQRAEVERLRDIAKFRRRQLAALEVRAGLAGVVQDIPLENGQWVAVGTVLAKVAEPGRLKADVRVAEGYAREVGKAMPVRFESPTGNFRGRVARVDPTVVTGQVRMEVALDEALPAGARADQTVTGFVEIEKLPNVLYVARPSGVQDTTNAGVFRMEQDHVHASRVPARFGRGSAKEIEILAGLAEGDEIVVSDTAAWEVGERVRLK